MRAGRERTARQRLRLAVSLLLVSVMAAGCAGDRLIGTGGRTPEQDMPRPLPGDAQLRVQSATLKLAELGRVMGTPAAIPVPKPELLIGVETIDGAMSLSGVIARALNSVPEARIGEVQLNQERARADAARQAMGPQITLEGSTAVRSSDGLSGLSPGAEASELSVALRQPLFNLSLLHDVELRKNDVETAEISRRNIRSLTALDIATAYLSVVQSALIVRFAEGHEEELDALLAIVGERVDAGGASPANRERVRARIETVRASISDIRAGLTENISEFTRKTGFIPDTLRVPATLGNRLPASITAAFEHAMEANNEIALSRIQLDRALLEERRTELKRHPVVNLELSHTIEDGLSATGGTQDQTEVGLNFNMTLFRNGQLDSERRLNAARNEEYELRLTQARRQLSRNLRNVYALLGSIHEQYGATVERLRASEAVVAAFEEQFLATDPNTLEVLEAYQTLYEARVEMTNLAVTEAVTLLQAKHLLGDLLAEFDTAKRADGK